MKREMNNERPTFSLLNPKERDLQEWSVVYDKDIGVMADLLL